MPTRTRFAPSPTGFLHIGSARTALFNWLFARHTKGEFILRIEDTDKERSEAKFETEILESLKWLGMDWDGEVYHQSKRSDVYKRHADLLLKEGKAYAEGKALRFKSPQEFIAWEDVIRSRIEFDGKLLDDLVIMKSDGSPTYSFACVCDDGEMKISHVIRGEDHISNTPKQLPLYSALGFRIPQFAHIPLILGEDRSRLSKRHGATSIREFRKMGYLPESMVNYLALLGWSPGENQELITRSELIEKFELKRVLSTGASFNQQKLDWISGEYIRGLSDQKLISLFAQVLKEAGLIKEPPPADWMKRFVDLYRKRVFRVSDIVESTAFFFKEDVTWDEEGGRVLMKQPNMGEVFIKYADALERLKAFDHEAVESASRDFMSKVGLSGKQFIHPARVAVTGRTVSASFFETVSLLGQAQVVKRLRGAADQLKT
jgi:glutamyl-tRNA synthetase